ncbi:MAG: aminotransferase class I/II-fold pyridoxal phosphate-dependent enzyme [Planctomycetes bacterium]|nr:aminotransferase class I/II-fold pyridoxal phosphate-dependent enzyme [Planctomycetota bacterium]
MSAPVGSNSNVATGRSRVSQRVSRVHQTALRRISARCAELGGVNLSQGICDVDPPVEILTGAKEAIDSGLAAYTHLAGIPELREEIARKLLRFNNIEADPAREIAVTVGAAGAFACAMMATLNPGDEVVLFSPFYSYYTDTLALLDVTVRFVATHAPDWSYDSKQLREVFCDKTKMVIINTPSNPTGKVFSRGELSEIAAIAKAHDAIIVSDEVYEYITFDAEHLSIATLPDAHDRTITLSGASKTYAVTGWRVGYAVGPADIVEKMLVVNDLFYICAPAPLQHGVLAAMRLGQSYYDKQRAAYRAKRDLLAGTLGDIGFTPFVPQGAFYMMADFGAGRYANSQAAAEEILETVGVATVPGAPFHANPDEGDQQLRFCFAKRLADLQDACDRLRRLGD